jgi:hypothetical protein
MISTFFHLYYYLGHEDMKNEKGKEKILKHSRITF